MRSGRGSKGETLSRGFPLLFILALGACAPIRWAVVVTLPCLSTPFLWCLPKETVSSRQRKALFLPRRLHHSRERYCLGGRNSSSPDFCRGGWCLSGVCTCAPIRWEVVVALSCDSTPFLLSCQKKRCRAAKEKRFDASTSPWWARPPLPFGVSPNGTDRCVKLVCTSWVDRVLKSA